MEQWKILSEYFIKKVLTSPDFSGTIGGFSTLRYAHIKGSFQIKNIPIVSLHKILKNLLKRLKLMREWSIYFSQSAQLLENVFWSFQEKKHDQSYDHQLTISKRSTWKFILAIKNSAAFHLEFKFSFRIQNLTGWKRRVWSSLAESAAYLLEKLPIHGQLEVGIIVKGKECQQWKSFVIMLLER